MKILLFDVNGYIFCARGIDLISAILKESNHSIKKVSLIRKGIATYKQEELKLLTDLIKDHELFLISVFSSYLNRAIQLTKFIKSICPEKKVIWGGPHCIAVPEMNLDTADVVCYSEAELIINDLVLNVNDDKKLSEIPNIAYKRDGKIIKTPIIQPISNLDLLPISDFELETHYIIDDKLDKLSDLDLPTLYQRTKEDKRFDILATRGCPIKCSYCNNSKQLEFFGKAYIRRRSIDHYFKEVRKIIEIYSPREIAFADDDFLMRKVDEIEEFIERYNKEINIPFSMFISPWAYSKEKMDILVKGKLARVRMGVQSGSERILKDVYRRHYPIEKIKKVLHEFNYYVENHGVKLNVNFIIDNPYEKPIDIYKTFRVVVKLPISYNIKVFALIFLPGTPIYNRAIKDGLLKDGDESSKRDFYGGLLYQRNYITYLLVLYRYTYQATRYTKYIYKLLGTKPFYFFGLVFLSPIIKHIYYSKAREGTGIID